MATAFNSYVENRVKKILQLNMNDMGGGAAKIAWDLFKEFQARGLDSWFAVGFKHSSDSFVFKIPYIPPSYLPWAIMTRYLQTRSYKDENRESPSHFRNQLLRALTDVGAFVDRRLGREDYNFRGSWNLLSLVPEKPDVLHIHNLHENYFDLRFLPLLSKQVPVVLTLHDAWLISGHCAHSFSCGRWETGCGSCPDLSIPPAIKRDSTAFNWERKRNIFTQSLFYVTTPSQWLMDKVHRSMLKPAIRNSMVIPNGVDLKVFHPKDQAKARAELGISKTAKVLFFAAKDTSSNVFKDMATLESAVSIVAERFPRQELKFITLGGQAHNKAIGGFPVESFEFTHDLKRVASFYQASDLYLHAARADTFPNVVLEALACGIPVVATAVGGIPEQITEGITGNLTPQGDPHAMAYSIQLLLNNDERRKAMGNSAVEDSVRRFSLEQQSSKYLNWYDEVIRDWQGRG